MLSCPGANIQSLRPITPVTTAGEGIVSRMRQFLEIQLQRKERYLQVGMDIIDILSILILLIDTGTYLYFYQ